MKVLRFLSVIAFTLLFGANAVAVTPRFLEADKLLAGDGASEDAFGYSVGFEGDTAVMGAWGDDDNGSDSGSAYVFTRAAGAWTEQQKLTASDGKGGVSFGFGVAVDGDTAVIGAWGDDDNGPFSGSAYVFTRSAGVWTEQQKLTPSDATAIDEFGESVAVDGDTVVVSAWLDDENGDNSGSIYVFTRSAGVWTERLKLLASDGRAEDHLGYFRPGLQLSGSTVVAGAPQDTTPGEPGAAYVFDVSVVNAVPIGGNSGGGAVGFLTVLLLLLCRRRTVS
jgi:hypothetical protein